MAGHIGLMLWRLYLRSRRAWKSMVLQILMPAVITFCFQSPGLTVDFRDVTRSVKTFDAASLLDPLSLFGLVVSNDSVIFPPNGNYDISYVPFNWTGPPMLLWAPSADKSVEAVMSNLTQLATDNFFLEHLLITPDHVKGFSDESALETWYLANPGRVWAAVVFDETGDKASSSWHYAVRINGSFTGTTDPALQTVDTQNFASVTHNESKKYLWTGAALLQWAVDQAIARVASATFNISGNGGKSAARSMGVDGEKSAARSMGVPDYPQYDKNTLTEVDIDAWMCLKNAGTSGNFSGCTFQKDIQVLEFPYIDNATKQLHWIFRFLNGFCINIGAMFTHTMLLTFLVTEKASFLKFGLTSAGLDEGAYWVSVAIHQLAPVSLLGSALIAGALYVDKVDHFSSFPVLWAFLFLYLVAGNSFVCFLSALMSRAAAAQNANSLIVFVAAVVYIAILSMGLGDVVKVPLCVVPAFAMHFIGDRMTVLEGNNKGLTWTTISEPFPLTSTVSCSLLWIALCMALSAVCWLYAAYYFSQILPDHLGNRRSVCFPCTCACAGSYRKRTILYAGSYRNDPLSANMLQISSDSEDMTCVLRTVAGADHHNHHDSDVEGGGNIGISKRFKRAAGICKPPEIIHAVRDLRLQVRQSEVFCLLGQNGAGKSTTVAMMTGQTPLSGGAIRYCLRKLSGEQSEQQWERIRVGTQADQAGGADGNAAVQRLRKYLGVCNQYDVLFPDLNALEHAFLFAALRRGNQNTCTPASREDSSIEAVYAQVRALLTQSGLPAGDELKPVGNLSGGNRRKVSLAMALMGSPALVFLDEPTAGMDPCSRRCVWGVVRDASREGSAVILTTHFLDEAECLGETIGIMKAGKMACCGTSLDLKRAFSPGLTIVLTHAKPSPSGVQASVAALEAIILEEVPRDSLTMRSAYPVTVSAAEINIGVPHTCPPDNLRRLVARLEDSLDQLQCSDLVLSTATLEQVFLNIAATGDHEDSLTAGANSGKYTVEGDTIICANSGKYTVEGDTIAPSPPPAPLLTADEPGYGHDAAGLSRTRLCVLRARVVCALFRIRFLEVLRARSALGTKVIMPLCFLLGAFIVGRTFSTDFITYFDPLRISPASVLSGTDGSGLTGAAGAVSCGDPWSIALMLPNASSDVAAPPASYRHISALAAPGDGSSRSCVAPAVAEFDFAEALVQTITPNIKSAAATAGPLSIGGFAYTNDGPLASVSPPWPDNAGFMHQTVGLIYNSSIVHSIPFLLNMYGRAMLRDTLGYSEQHHSSGSSDTATPPDIVVDVHPLPHLTLDTVDIASLMIPMFVASAFSSVSLSALTLVKQRENKVSHAMKLAGLSTPEFWLTQYLFDAAFGGVLVVIAIVCIFAFDATWFLGAERMEAMVAVLVSSTLAIAIMGYILAAFFRSAATASRVLQLVVVALTIVPYLLAWIMQQNANAETREAGHTVAQILNIVPTIALQNGIANIMVYSKDYPEGGGGGIWNPSHRILQSILFNAGTVMAAALTLLGYTLVANCTDTCHVGKKDRKVHVELSNLIDDEAGDEFVAAEKLRAQVFMSPPYHRAHIFISPPCHRAQAFMHSEPDRGHGNNDGGLYTAPTRAETNTSEVGGLVVAGLTKRYAGVTCRRALDGLSLVVPPGELLVLLGPNGAGKSTLMNILTGDLPLASGCDGGGCRKGAFTRGQVHVAGVNLHHEGTRTVFQKSLLGFCAQHDSLFEDITVEEHLNLYAHIRNTPHQVLAGGLCKALGLDQYRRTAAGKLSGGNKRKLSLALALLGTPRVVILDEPTTGVDAHAKRRVWKVLVQYHQQTRSAMLLSTHSMEEAQAVASRVAILTAGVLRCVGTARQLYLQYGFGYELEVELGLDVGLGKGVQSVQKDIVDDNKAAFCKFVTETWPGAAKTMEFNFRLIFQIPRDGKEELRVSSIIGMISKVQARFGVRDFSVSTTSLEHLFQSFASQQSTGSH